MTETHESPRDASQDKPAHPEPADRLAESVEIRAERHRQWTEKGEPAIAHRLAQIGVLGWMVVTPMLIGLFVGRWLDQALGSRLTFAGALLMVGTGLGAWSAWKWMNRT